MKTFYFIISLALLILGASLNQELTAMGCSSAPFAVAARLVKKYDHMTPTAKDIKQVTRNYAAYIVDCAKYEIENAK